MGTYFSTCTSVGTSNSKTVLTNAADANKHVIYLRDARQHVLARQLIAVTKDNQLLGYQCYVNIENTNEKTRDEIIASIASYCARLARNCGLSLADDGIAESIGDEFWYDDGTHPWHKAAHAAYQVASQEVLVCLVKRWHFPLDSFRIRLRIEIHELVRTSQTLSLMPTRRLNGLTAPLDEKFEATAANRLGSRPSHV